MLKEFLTIREGQSSQSTIQKSCFICHIKTTLSVDEADQFIREIKKAYPQCTNASAYIVGDSGENQRARDNGEPSNSAGLPILEALKLYPITNTTAVVSRVFGGQLLGIPGLKRAYGGAVKKAVEELGLVQQRLQTGIQVNLPYHFINQVEYELKNQNWIHTEEITYQTSVQILCFVDQKNKDKFVQYIKDLTLGQATFLETKDRYIAYPVNSLDYL